MFAETPACDDASWCASIRDLFIIDAHSDTLLHRDPSQATDFGHVDLARLIQGGVDVQVFAMASVAPKIVEDDDKTTADDSAVCGSWDDGDRLGIFFPLKEPFHPETWLSPMGRVDRLINRFDQAVGKQASDGSTLVRIGTKADLDALMTERNSRDEISVGALLAIEGAYWASEDRGELTRQLDKLEAAGVRMIGLTHRSSNQLAGSNEDCWDRHGLTDLGFFAVAEIWKRNMVLDLAHASSATIADVAQLSSEGKGGPVIVSHTGVKSACKHDRNLSDEDLRNVVRSDGVVSLGFWTTVNCIKGAVTAQQARLAIARSFAVAYQILSTPEFAAEMGPGYETSSHIALGSDFDGATLVPADASAIPWYLEGIAKVEADGQRVFDRASIENVAGKNLLRLLLGAMKNR
ncbi:dipeptidase [Actibacterium pelagium]|nr:membrane dipeptidase [Actibacterium pelagium]